MSKDANPAELRTPVIVEAYTDSRDRDGYKTTTWCNVFGRDKGGRELPLYVKWVNLHGAELFEAMSQQLKEPATITSRYSSAITEKCRMIKLCDVPQRDALRAAGKDAEADGLYYEVISLDDVEERHEWLELKVKRMVQAR